MGKGAWSRRRRWVMGLGLVATILAGLLVAAVLALRAYAPSITRERVEAALTEVLKRPVRVGSVTLSLWRGRVAVTNLLVEPGPGEGSEPILRLGRGELRVGLSSLWRREIVLSTILLEDVSLRLSASSGDTSPARLDVPDHLELGPITVRIRTVRVERGHVLYRDEARRLTAEVRDLRATARPVGGGIDARLSLAAISLQTPAFRETLTAVEGSGSIRQELLSIRALAGRWNDRQIRVAGEVRHPFAAAEANLRVQAEGDLAAIARSVEAPWPLAGVATVEADVRGPLTAPQISGRVAVPRLTAGPLQAQDVAIRGQGNRADVALTVRAKVDLAPLAGGLKAPWPLAGVATVEADVRGPLTAPQISGRVAVPRLTAGPLQAQDVAIRGQGSRGALDLPEVSARIFGGALRGSVRATLDRLEATRVSVVLQRVSVAALDALASNPLGVSGELDAEVEVEGDPRRWEETRGRFRFTGRRVVLPKELRRLGQGTLRVEGAFQRGIAALSRTAGSWTGLQVRASGGLGLEGPMGLRLGLDADLGTLGPLWDVRNVAGRATLEGEASGRWTDPTLNGEARATPLTVAGITLDTLRTPFQLHGTTLAVDSATASLGRSRAIVSGAVTWGGTAPAAPGGARPLRFRADVRAPAVYWEELHRWLPTAAQGSGRLALAGRVEGTPGAWRAEGTIEAPALTTHDVPIQDLQATFGLDQDRVDVSRLGARARGVPVDGTGTWAWNGNGQGTIEAGPVDLAGVPDLPAALTLRGTGQARVQVAVRSGIPEASGTARLEGTAVQGVVLGDGSGQFSLRGGQLLADLAFPDLRLSASVRGRADGDQPLAVRVDVRELALAPLLRDIERARHLDLDGTLSAKAELLVPPSAPSAARGTLTLDPVRILVVGEEWTNQGPVTLRWEPGLLTVDRLSVTSRLGSLRVSGRADPKGALNLQFDGRVPLAILPALRPEIREAAGTLAIAGRIEGTAAAPRPTGEATIHGGTLQLRDRPETFRDVEARMLFSAQGLRLAEATGTLGRGRVRASGDLTLDGWRPGAYRITASGTNVSIAPFDGLQTAWDLDLELSGRGPRMLLRGEGRLLQGRYSGQLSLLSLLLSRRSEAAASTAPAIPLRILLKLNDNLRVDTNWARLRVGGTLSLEGTTVDPIVLGALESQEGRITFRKQRWTVSSAAVRFVDPRRIEPNLDLTGRAQIKDYDVTLRISGRPDELTFGFSSVPALTQEEILTLVTLGITKRDASQSPGGVVMGEVAQLLAQDVLGLAGGGYAPETLQLETTDKKEQVVAVGKQLTEDFRVLYSQTISGGSKRVLRVEYQVIGPLVLAGEQDFQGGFGGDVLIRLRFR